MSYLRRAQERLTHNNQYSEQPLGMQLSNYHKRRIRENNLHEKKDSDWSGLQPSNVLC